MTTTVIKSLILPPGIFLVFFVLAGLLLLARRRLSGSLLMLAGLIGLYLCSIPAGSYLLNQGLEKFPAADLKSDEPGQAIVALGAGVYASAPEYGTDTISSMMQTRVRYAAHLAKKTRKPVLIAGGGSNNHRPEAEAGKEVLEKEYGVPARWIDSSSSNTWENALNSARILSENNITHIYLVTHAFHMPRAVYAFESQGLKVTPAPTGFLTHQGMSYFVSDWLPNAQAAHEARNALHEYLGLLWYRIRYQ